MKKLLAALLVFCCTALPALAQTSITLPIAANTIADLGNGPIKARVVAGNASIFTSQSSGLGSTSGSSTTLTLTATPATPPLVGGLISGAGITSGTTITAYNGTTGVTLSAAMTVSASTPVAWGAACPSTPPSNVIRASVSAGYYIMYTQARVCAVSPGGPVNTLLIEPVFLEGTSAAGGAVSSVSNSDGTLSISPGVGNVIASCTTATTGQAGCVKPDGTTITISGGVISSTGAVSSVSGTAGQITVSPTIGATIVSLPSTITSNETFTGTLNVNGQFQIGGANVNLPISLGDGGTSAGLVASNGGIVYSTGSAMAILAGTVTASQCLLSGSLAAPTWGSCAGGAAVSSVSNSDGTLTISPTTGSVVGGIALGHPNTWTGAQTFSGGATVTTSFTATGLVTNADLANSTISGVSLGSNLASLTATDGSLTFSGAYNGGTARTAGCTTATTGQLGCVKPDGTTVTISSGVISAVGGSATSFHASTFTTTGGGTFTPSATALYKVTVIAGGGQGGVGLGSPGGGGGGGGGGGATCYYYATLNNGTGYALTVGAANTNSTFVNGATTVTATHGGTGASASGGGSGAVGGAGGTCTNATIGPVAGGDGGSGASGDIDLTGTSTGAGGNGGGGGGAGGTPAGGNAASGAVFGSGGGGSGGNGGTIGTGKQGALIIEGVF